ncbi:MAG: hypothetical protein DLM61_07345 [Pseudonocardiales bacterium]|nr:MAG: hypothetical protein DLM61_07345 [Pseudonocardiales bacterium]
MPPIRSSPVAAPLVAALETCWSAIQVQHGDVPDVVVSVGAGSTSHGRLKLGHFAAGRWQRGEDKLSELFIGGEGLRRGVIELLATLLHEAAHGVAMTRELQDTSRQGRYHNARFRAIGEELGLGLDHSATDGWSTTTLAEGTAGRYTAAAAKLKRALVVHRLAEVGAGGRANNNNGLAALCGCPRKIRLSPGAYELGPIVCGVCRHPFIAVRADEADRA